MIHANISQHADAWVPVTGLAEFKYGTSSLLLQGQGPFMSVISNDSGKQIARLKVFRRNNVHGFMIDRACNDGVYILVWGGQSLRVVQFSGQRTKPDSNGAYLVNCTAEYAAPDWIFDACAPHTDDREAFAYLVTAHNAVLRVKLSNLDSSKYPRAIFLQQLVMGVKSILYSANIVAFGPSHIVIAAGTVFGEIIVWSCFLDQISSSQPDATAAIHHFFTGHEGSIFGVNISHEVLDKDGKRKRFLASCSDDRTIRIWDISDCCHATSADPSAYWTDGFELRSTGFGSTATENVTAGTEKYVAKAYGHLSRIWKVKFLPTMTKQVQRINLMSAGEDTTCQLWMLELPLTPAEQQYRLTNVTTLHRHAGKNIWSVALSSHPLEIYTGGADGAVRSFRLTFFGDAETKHPARQNESEISSRTYWSSKAVEKAGRSKVQTDDQPKVFAFVSQDSFLRISASGVVQIGRIENGENDTQPSIVCEPIAVVPDLKGFASLSSLPRTGIAIIGSGSGLIRLFDFSSRQLSDLVTVQSRPVTIFLFRAHTNQDGNSTLRRRVKFAVTYPNLPYADLFSVEQVNSETRHVDRARLLLPVPFAVSSSSLLLDGKYIMFGGKFGGMVLYKVEYGNDCELVWRDHRAHGTSLVSFMGTIPKDNDLEELTTDYLLTCGRDGNYSVYMLKSGFSEPRMIHRASLSLGQIEGFYFDPTSGHLMFIGFRGTMFVLWNESTQSEIMTFDCGNVHRWWVFQPYEDVPECGVILWNQARSLHAIDIRTSESRIIRVGSHGREIKDLAVFNPPQENAVPLIASGAEDTALRISTPSTCDTDPMWGSLRSLRVFTTHQTGLQKVSWSRDGRYLFSSAGQEEFFVWRMRLIPVFGLAAVVEARTEPVDKNADPRVTNFDIREIELSSGTDRFLIALVYSNSVVKVCLCFLFLLWPVN